MFYVNVKCVLPLLREHTLRIFEDKVLREMFGLRREKPMEDWIKLLEELLCTFCLTIME